MLARPARTSKKLKTAHSFDTFQNEMNSSVSNRVAFRPATEIAQKKILGATLANELQRKKESAGEISKQLLERSLKFLLKVHGGWCLTKNTKKVREVFALFTECIENVFIH